MTHQTHEFVRPSPTPRRVDLFLQVTREALWSSGRTVALDAARPRSIPVGGENY